MTTWRAVDDLGHSETYHGEFVVAMAHFAELWAKLLHARGKSVTRTIEVTSETEEQAGKFAMDYIYDGPAV